MGVGEYEYCSPKDITPVSGAGTRSGFHNRPFIAALVAFGSFLTRTAARQASVTSAFAPKTEVN